ncbi:MAG: sirohydrochlorin cobaltochelatase [Faecousia sp.]
MKNALLAVSFGTVYPDALESDIAPIEQALAAACPGWPLYRAFTGDTIRQRLARNGLAVDSVSQAMARLAAEGVTHVAVQPIYVTQGGEYQRLCAQLEPYRQRMRIALGTPLLDTDADFETVADALPQWLPPLEDGEALILMGHGSEGTDNAAYVRLAQVLQARRGRYYAAVMTGEPTLESVMRRLSTQPQIQKLMLAPFLLTAGGHTRKDMVGWEASLKAAGYPVRCVARGLGECPRTRELFAAHCLAAAEALEENA